MVLYQRIITKIGSSLPPKLQPIWFHPAAITVCPSGPTTIFFWAPAMKWGLVIAGINDMVRPPETVSVAQTASLAITGAIWSRYSLVIVPKNWVLFSVNVVVFLTNIHNCTRGLMHQMDKKY